MCPFYFYSRYPQKSLKEEFEDSKKDYGETIEKTARYFDKGFPVGYHGGDTKSYKQSSSRRRRAKNKNVMRSRLNDWDDTLFVEMKNSMWWDLT